MNPWFRMYSEIADDPKVQMMPEAMQRRLVMLMCLKCKGRLGKLSDMEIAFELRIPFPEASETKVLFLTQGFIDEKWDLVNWNKRQFISDSSTDRTRRYRERHETSRERHCDGAEQNRTEQKQKKHTPKAALSSFAIPPSIEEKTWADFEEHRKKLRKPMTDRARNGVVSDLGKLGGDPNAILAQSITRGWAGVFELKSPTPALFPVTPKPKTQYEIDRDEQQAERRDAIRKAGVQ
jgi:hypothetical protein